MPDLTPLQRMVAAAQAAVEAEKAARTPAPAPSAAKAAPVRPSTPSQPPTRRRTRADDRTAWKALVADVGGEEAVYLLEERAAIMEYHGEMPRIEAEKAARACVLEAYR